eukprot:gnl/TRDRNA2_/TRDRNA2_130386_c0_seq1.p1 gnl/TRDRNA2_/TRDRNA2_130386_c0~~gnl/TRDRNA2_/TRDRNA2_130386_c0_seq1.p1  ORF type:complete len:184 (+),score=24.96 gnl/TRDRNA2_/TRDRNA2_130386_c0_seq1:247-798(+)
MPEKELQYEFAGPTNVLARHAGYNKTYNWFKHARKAFPWATHIAKMDSDTFPFIPHVLHDLQHSSHGHVIWGELALNDAAHRAHGNIMDPGSLSFCEGGFFMSGPLYVLSTRIQNCWLQHMEQTKSTWSLDKPEDDVFASSLCEAVRAKACPEPAIITVSRTDLKHLRYIHPKFVPRGSVYRD